MNPSPITWSAYASPLGAMVLAATSAGLCGVWFEGQQHFDGPATDWRHDPADTTLIVAAAQLDDWFAGRRQAFDLPLDPQGTAFQRAVWSAIAQIGFGRSQAYGEVAATLGRPSASRAVGAATGRNPISIIVPCHRLLGRSGALTGYAGGLERKQALLAFEAGERLP
jgi:methylated-DNA-[protein]-cysteine S-methyltransferase